MIYIKLLLGTSLIKVNIIVNIINLGGIKLVLTGAHYIYILFMVVVLITMIMKKKV